MVMPLEYTIEDFSSRGRDFYSSTNKGLNSTSTPSTNKIIGHKRMLDKLLGMKKFI